MGRDTAEKTSRTDRMQTVGHGNPMVGSAPVAFGFFLSLTAARELVGGPLPGCRGIQRRRQPAVCQINGTVNPQRFTRGLLVQRRRPPAAQQVSSSVTLLFRRALRHAFCLFGILRAP